MEFTDLIHQPDALYTAPEVADTLGMSAPSAALVAASGICGPVFQRGKRRDVQSTLVPASTLKCLAAIPWITEHPAALVVRVRPARLDPDDPDRPFMGWHPGATWNDQCLGVGRWWRIRDPERWHGEILVATIVGYVAFVARIEGHRTAPGGAVAFNLEHPENRTLEAFQHYNHETGQLEPRRIEITQGGVTVHLDESEGWTR